MDKATECVRLAKQLGWKQVVGLDSLQELGVPGAVHGETVWIFPEYYAERYFAKRWTRQLDFDPWEDANDDLRVLEMMKSMPSTVWGDYKDALYHETKGHGTHNVWEYKKGKFANAAIMLADRLGWR